MEDVDTWREAGRIAFEALQYGRKLIVRGALLLEVGDLIDAKVRELGAKPAWPAQISCDDIAAHYCASANDKTVFEDQVVSLDVGVHLDGIIGDNAVTVDLSGKYSDLLKASSEALKVAIRTAGIGVKVSEIGRAIEETILAHGFKPVKNLSGHCLNPWIIHDKPSIPNFDTGDETELQEGQVIAIEPFATNGAGMIEEKGEAELFAVVNKKPVRNPFVREVLAFIDNEYKNLPFAKRWLVKKFGDVKTTIALNDFSRLGIIGKHPPLVERGNGLVSVEEKTLLIGEKVEVLTKV